MGISASDIEIVLNILFFYYLSVILEIFNFFSRAFKYKRKIYKIYFRKKSAFFHFLCSDISSEGAYQLGILNFCWSTLFFSKTMQNSATIRRSIRPAGTNSIRKKKNNVLPIISL